MRPDFVMPYMSETVKLAQKGLYLRKQGVSYEGIAYVLGGSEMHWYNLCQSLGRVSIVGTTVKRAEQCPPSNRRREAYSAPETEGLSGRDSGEGMSPG